MINILPWTATMHDRPAPSASGTRLLACTLLAAATALLAVQCGGEGAARADVQIRTAPFDSGHRPHNTDVLFATVVPLA